MESLSMSDSITTIKNQKKTKIKSNKQINIYMCRKLAKIPKIETKKDKMLETIFTPKRKR